jgi:NADPH:quinone reductase-like Zn-dependent oxidoreductase/NADP-dependent 3-hydroxy acid dehydrogenase YdfG
MYPGRFATYEVVPAWSCIKLHDNEKLHIMAGALVVFMTAVYALHHRARLQRGESILIHSAAGGVGIAVIQLAKLAGAEIFATVGTEEKKQYLVDTVGLDEGHIFSSHDASFAAGIRAATNGRGVDVVLNSLIGELLHESWGSCLADWGRFVEIGKRDIIDHGRLDMGCFARGTTFTAFDLSMFSESSSPDMHQPVHEMMAHVLELLRTGEIQPIQPLAVFKVAEMESALSYFKNRNRIGKIVVSFEDETQIVPVVPERYMTHLSAQKSYLLVGCLGGLGRSLSRWMIGRGARHFVFLGRTGHKKPAARRLIEELERDGAHCTVITGDVINYSDVERAVQADGAMVPLSGVVQAAMGLHESMFKYITHEVWQTGTRAKVQGTWNLHRALSAGNEEKDLDFFLLTSSVAGKVGTATEANYCAANNFLDAFAQYRRGLGLKAISLGLGMVSEVGYLHEHRDIGTLLLRKGIRPLLEDEMLQIVDFALAQQLTPTSVHDRDALA